MRKLARQLLHLLLKAARDLAPLALVVAFFEIVVLRQTLPDLERVLTGIGLVALGLGLFVRGLEMGLFPLGEGMAAAFARKGSLMALLSFAFLLGFGTSAAEPALIAIALEGAKVAVAGGIIATEHAGHYALAIRATVATAVGLAITLGMLRILKGWLIQGLVLAGYVAVITVSAFAPKAIVGFAFDAGIVAASTVTVPLVAALGVGLASSIRGRNPISDGFGLLAVASLFSILSLLIFGIVVLGPD